MVHPETIIGLMMLFASFIMQSSKVAGQVLHFLAHGKFAPPAA